MMTISAYLNCERRERENNNTSQKGRRMLTSFFFFVSGRVNTNIQWRDGRPSPKGEMEDRKCCCKTQRGHSIITDESGLAADN